MPVSFIEYVIVKTTGWTYTEIDKQPTHRIMELLEWAEVESEARH